MFKFRANFNWCELFYDDYCRDSCNIIFTYNKHFSLQCRSSQRLRKLGVQTWRICTIYCKFSILNIYSHLGWFFSMCIWSFFFEKDDYLLFQKEFYQIQCINEVEEKLKELWSISPTDFLLLLLVLGVPKLWDIFKNSISLFIGLIGIYDATVKKQLKMFINPLTEGEKFADYITTIHFGCISFVCLFITAFVPLIFQRIYFKYTLRIEKYFGIRHINYFEKVLFTDVQIFKKSIDKGLIIFIILYIITNCFLFTLWIKFVYIKDISYFLSVILINFVIHFTFTYFCFSDYHAYLKIYREKFIFKDLKKKEKRVKDLEDLNAFTIQIFKDLFKIK